MVLTAILLDKILEILPALPALSRCVSSGLVTIFHDEMY